MVALRWTVAAVLTATAVSASTDELQFIARLLKRQEVGSAAYNCHDNCGQAIIEGRSSDDVCNDEIFLTDYKACLQCSGPDNQDIWQYYGTTLTKDASACGLSTTPLSGSQPDVGAAIPAGGSTSSATSTATEASSTETPTATSSATSEATTAATSTATSGETSAQGTTASATVSASVTSASSPVTTTYTPTGTGSASGNGTATTSSGLVVVTSAANANAGSSVGFYGALALGALYAAAQ
ncbi:uncharacterized protein F4807DRAFT_130399 [Annulohypoxylon truncatum]|uniref:uncharacterized protein n=1 Tax=Annulohypoxylon truncatum TaxID=327061 RepID=UPI0020076B34|nr:uncharacterized protein F4807DRAFT_130399 [Annulohypoxylon truncatum]KAI1208704.1 hypothetical protein F4807DRAFT_130399 [Annulohypoxylon truncatum]